MSGADFIENASCGHLLLSGNAYVEGVLVGDRLRELHLLRPDRIAVVEGPDGWPAARGQHGSLGTRSSSVRRGGMARRPDRLRRVPCPPRRRFRKSEAQITTMLARAVGRGRRGL